MHHSRKVRTATRLYIIVWERVALAVYLVPVDNSTIAVVWIRSVVTGHRTRLDVAMRKEECTMIERRTENRYDGAVDIVVSLDDRERS